MRTVKKLFLSIMLFIICFTSLSIFSTAFAAPAPAIEPFSIDNPDIEPDDNPDREPAVIIPGDSPSIIPDDPISDPVVITSATVSTSKNPYDPILSTTIIGNEGLETALLGDVADGKGTSLFNNQIFILIKYIINIFIVIGITIAFFGGYKILTSSGEDAMKDGIRLVIYGILGIIIMVSARFIATSLVGGEGLIKGQFDKIYFDVFEEPSGVVMAQALYERIAFPFIKIALYLVAGILFVMMAIKVISFVTSTDDTVKKKAGGVIIWCVVGILIVMGSKQIVESIMGKQEKVLNEYATNFIGGELGIGNEIMQFESIPIIVQIINWVMGLTTLVLLILIIIQGYKMFAKPDDAKNRESLKKTILYIIIGVLVIGAAYVISNVLVINNLPNIS